MRTFTIDSENNITVFASMQQAKTSNETGAVIFTTQEELTKLADGWKQRPICCFRYRL